jgi:aryl sulfotransferase
MEERQRYRTFVADSARWDGFSFREGDIVITTPPKCGTTWMQMLCALLIFRTPDLPAPLARLSPWLDMQLRPLDAVLTDLDAQAHRRFIKTHTPLDGLPMDPRVTYLSVARDPRDAALSWDNHVGNMDLDRFVTARVGAVGADDLAELGITGPPPEPPEDPADRFWLWMEGDPTTAGSVSGLASLVHHVAMAWQRRDEPNIVLFHYGDLRADLVGQADRLAGILGVEPPGDLVQHATFEAMKARADDLAPNVDTPVWRENSRFFDRARTGGWQELTGPDGPARYEALIDGLMGPELKTWLRGGWLGAASPSPS